MLGKIYSASVLALFFILPAHSVSAASAVNASYSLNEDTAKTVPLRGGCNRSETKSLSVGNATHGTVTLSGNNAIYSPTANYNGSDSFTFRVSCSSSGSATGTVSLTINGVNDLPTATTTTGYTTNEDTTLSGQVTGSDVDNDPLTFSASSAMGGSIAMDSSGRFTFTPVTNTSGNGSFTYRVWDGYAYSSAVTVPVTINAVNDAPVAVTASRSLNEDSPVTLTLQASDIDSSSLSYAIVDQPMFGSVVLSGNTASYTPNSNYHGIDQFTFVVSDGEVSSNAVSIDLTINAVNDVPTAAAVAVTTDSRSSVVVDLAGADVDGDTLSYAIPINPTFGTVGGLTTNQVTYTPRDGYVGEDSFTYAVTDGTRTVSAAVTITVEAIPTAGEITIAVVQGETVEITPVSSNATSEDTTYTLTAEPRHGTISTIDTIWTYTAPADYVGIDTLMYTANTATATSDPMMIRVNVTAPTGIAGTDIVQLGINFLNLLNDEGTSATPYLSILEDLGVQAVRQVGDGDYTWATIEVRDNTYRNTDTVATVRREFHTAGIQVIGTLFKTMFASCTNPSADEMDPDQLVQTLTADCIDYIEYVDDDLAATTPAGETIYFEAGNELFHWVINPEYTPTEQAAVSGYAIDSVLTSLREQGYQAYSITPSITIDSSATWEWWDEFMTALDTATVASSSTDLPYINYHYYSEDATYRSSRQTFEDADRWVNDKLMILTEFGFSDLAAYERTENNNPQTKAERFVKLATMAWGAGDTAVFVHPLYYSTEDNDFPGMGLVYDDLTYTPEAYSYRLVTQELLPFRQVTDLSDDNVEQYIYQFITEAGSTKYIVWGTDGLTVPTGVTTATSMYADDGNFIVTAVTSGNSLTLSDTPLLLE